MWFAIKAIPINFEADCPVTESLLLPTNFLQNETSFRGSQELLNAICLSVLALPPNELPVVNNIN